MIYQSLEEMLGNKEDRYFGDRFRLVGLKIIERHIKSIPFRFKYCLMYPKNWSKHNGIIKTPPHLSTLDATVLSIKSIEIYLNNININVSNCFIEELSIKSGNRLVENISNLEAEFDYDVEDNTKFVFKGNIENFRVKLVIREQFKIRDDFNGLSYYEEQFKKFPNELTHISIAKKYIEGSYKLDNSKLCIAGLDSSLIRSNVTMPVTDFIIYVAQLTEGYFQFINDSPRDDSNSLIMRNLKICRTNGLECKKNILHIENKKTKIIGVQGEKYMVSRLEGKTLDTFISYSVTQLL
jgi:hypothetical protein